MSPAVKHIVRKSSIWFTRPNVAASFKLVRFCPSKWFLFQRLILGDHKSCCFMMFQGRLSLSVLLSHIIPCGEFLIVDSLGSGLSPFLSGISLSLYFVTGLSHNWRHIIQRTPWRILSLLKLLQPDAFVRQLSCSSSEWRIPRR